MAYHRPSDLVRRIAVCTGLATVFNGQQAPTHAQTFGPCDRSRFRSGINTDHFLDRASVRGWR